jgi:hypothetical protein
MTQQLIVQYTDLFNCVTLWKYANALATTGLESYAFEFMRMNWDAILEMVGRERMESLFELFLPPIDRTKKLKVVEKTPVAALESTVPPSPMLTVLRDFTADKRVEKRGKGATSHHGSKAAPVVVATVGAETRSISRPISSEASARVEEAAAAVTLVPSRGPRKKTAKFVSLDAFLDQKKRDDGSSQPTKADATPVVRELASPWRSVPSSSSALPSSASGVRVSAAAPDVDDGFSIGRPKLSRKGSVGQYAAPPATPPLLPSVRAPNLSIPASPGLAALSLSAPPALGKPLLAQDGSERQLLSTFSLDAFMKKQSSRNSRKNQAVVDDAKPSWSAAAATPLAKAPAKTLKEIQQEEEARVAAEAAAKARNGSYVRRTSTVNSWGLCEAQSHVSFAELQQIQENQEFVEQQRQILAQIEMEHSKRQQPQPQQQQNSTGGRKKSSKAAVKKAKDAPKKPEHKPAEAERKATKKKREQQPQQRTTTAPAASGRHDGSDGPSGNASKAKKKARESRGRTVGASPGTTQPGNAVSAA